ncbi:MAG: single-stranded-DNA-specific exonuclease RecJ [Oceanospirillaceae bacterium]|nr:single-stranded-DNA-specific exonuclease RecJ [Oceanospirillaceae bacterium]
MVRVVQRPLPESWQLDCLHPALQRVYAARGVLSEDRLALNLAHLLPYHSLKGIDQAVQLLVDAMTHNQQILVVGDFDVDGATSTALVIRALRMMGFTQVDFLVPNRFDFGYGLTPELVGVACQLTNKPALIVTVDNGIASVDGVAAAQAAGIKVLVTDHHLPGDELPDAEAIVNPNQPGCRFPSKNACGCTVAFYLMLALRARLNEIGYFTAKAPNLADLLDLVALATVADVVALDYNNRILVEQGLRRIRAGQTAVGITALMQVAGRNPQRAVSSDFGFIIGPRLNAAGRLDDMSIGIDCLLTDDPNLALDMAQQLDELNRDRKHIEAAMTADAQRFIDEFDAGDALPFGLALHHTDWHQGVIGILASRIKDKVHRPVIAFADGDDGLIKGSARSIAGFHLRDALDLVDKRAPGMLVKFGGHAMAAGMTVRKDRLDEFRQAFDQVCREQLSEAQLTQTLEVDGQLDHTEFVLEFAEQLRHAGPWGQGFPEPLFEGVFQLAQQRIVGGRHLKLVLAPDQHASSGLMLDAIWFNIDPAQWPNASCHRARIVFQLDINEYRGRRSIQLLVRHLTSQ